MIPKFKAYFCPFLLLLHDGKPHKIAEIRTHIANYYDLSETELKERTKGGENKHASRTNWAVTYLKRMRLIQTQQKGLYLITDIGKQSIEQYGDKFDLSVLRDMEGYHQFQAKVENDKTHWVAGHYRADGTYVPGYLSNFISKGIRKKNDESEI